MLFQTSRLVKEMLGNRHSVSPAFPEVIEATMQAMVFGRLKAIPTERRAIIVRDDALVAAFMLLKTGMATILEAKSIPPYVVSFLQQRFPDRVLVVDSSVSQQYDGTFETLEDAVRQIRNRDYHMSLLFAHVHPMDVATGEALDRFLDENAELVDAFGHLLLHLPDFGGAEGDQALRPTGLISRRLGERLLFTLSESSSTPESLGSCFVSDTVAEPENPYREEVISQLEDLFGGDALRQATKAEDFLTPLLDRGPRKATLYSSRVPILN